MKDPEVFDSVVDFADKPMESVDVRDNEACSMTSLILSFDEGKGVEPQGLPGSCGESTEALWKDNKAPLDGASLFENGLFSC